MKNSCRRHDFRTRRDILFLGQCAIAAAASVGWPGVVRPATAQTGGAAGDPGKAISAAIQSQVNAHRADLEKYIKAQLGRGDMISKGVTLYNINFRLGKPNFGYTKLSFDYKINENYLYFESTTPSVFGSYADPAFEVHFDVSLTGAVSTASPNKPRVQTVIAAVPRLTVTPRNVAGGVVTTVVHFFQQTEGGRRIIQNAVDKNLRRDLTKQINAQLQRL